MVVKMATILVVFIPIKITPELNQILTLYIVLY